MMLVSPQSADGDARESGASQPDQDIVLRAALRSALQSVQSVCEQLFAQLASARNESTAAAVAASERIAAIQAEAESAAQRTRLEIGVEVSELGREVERLRNEMKRNEAVMLERGGSAEIEALRNALALSQSDFDEVNRRLLEEKQKHTRLIEAVRSMGTMNTLFRSVPAVAPEFDAMRARPAQLV
jgi:uncharacterized protein YhaN